MQQLMDVFWRSKFGSGKREVSFVVDGCCSDVSIADNFATVFSFVCVPNSPERHEDHRKNFYSQFAQCIIDSCENNLISVELVEKCIKQLKKGKAAGMDQLTAEHISFAHPILVVQLWLLFKIMLMHLLVLDSFGYGLIIPLLKVLMVIEQPHIITGELHSNFLELVLMIIFQKYLQFNCLQF